MELSYRTLLFIFILINGCIHKSFTKDQEDQNYVIENENIALNVGQKVETDNKFNLSEYRLLLKKTPNDKPYGVYDNWITAKEQILLRRILNYDNTAWVFNNYDADGENKQRNYDNTPWINDQDPLAFSSSKLLEKLIATVKDVSKDEGPYYPYRVFGKILRRGDGTKVAADSQDNTEYTAMIFMNEFWRKNYYGEIYFYDDNKEIVGGATHKSARLVVWRSDIYRLNRPPAIQFLQGQLLFQVQFTKNKDKMMEGHKNYTDSRKARDEADSKWNIPDYEIPGGIENLDIEKHKTFEYTTKTDGRKIFVYDDLFPKDILDHLRSFVLKYGAYFYDDSIDSDSDNVQWIAGFQLAPYIKSPYWKIIQKAASDATGNHEMFPYDVSINLVRSSDHTRIHSDVGYHGEEEFTCLVYLNPKWDKNYYGETTFFEKNSDDTEIVAQVRPRYGRLVIFDGNIPHSARPPSFNYSGARLTFVTKLHRNEYTGRRKNFQEELRFFITIVDSNKELKTYKTTDGEFYAQQQLKASREHQMALVYNANPKKEEDADEDTEQMEETENLNEKSKAEQENEQDESSKQLAKQLEENMKLGKRFVVRKETPILEEDQPDKITMKLIKPLMDLNEDAPDAVKKLTDVHKVMSEKSIKFSNRYKQKLLEIL